MSQTLVFMMGRFAAEIPTDRRYAPNHMWCTEREGRYRFGFTAYAVRLLQDVFFLEWSVEAPAAVGLRQQIGSIESSKAASALFAPMAGTILAFNEQLLDDPSEINLDNYGSGWLFEMSGDGMGLMTASEYVEYLQATWPQAQRRLRGQLG